MVRRVFNYYHCAKRYIEIPLQTRSLYFKLFNCINAIIFRVFSKNMKAPYSFPQKFSVRSVNQNVKQTRRKQVV